MSTQPPAANVGICACEEDHVAAITTIYAHHVLHGLAPVLPLEPVSGLSDAHQMGRHLGIEVPKL